jgi:hypothetical protein
MATNLTTGTSNTPPQADRLRQEMRTIRRELGDDVEELVEQAERLMDWRYHVERYPWGCLGAAALAGFFLVPGRTVVSPVDEQTLTNLVERFSPVEKKETVKKSTLFNWALTAALGLASRAALAYATQQVSKIVAAQMPPPDPVEVHHG